MAETPKKAAPFGWLPFLIRISGAFSGQSGRILLLWRSRTGDTPRCTLGTTGKDAVKTASGGSFERFDGRGFRRI
ncbi:MAG: hypothetical protein CW346_15715 [Bacillaceae bacterium]|nr:hypothetical protein [Bacillaceae bacterium]